MTAKVTDKLVIVSYANADKGEQIGIFQRGDWILCRDAIYVDEFIQPGPRRRQLSSWGIPENRVDRWHGRML